MTMKKVRPIDANALNLNDIPCHYGCNCDLEDVEEWVFNAPTLDYAPVRHGHWIHCAGKSNLWYCSECGGKILYNPTRRTYNIIKLSVDEMNRFCRSCGAKMDGKEHEQ